MIIFILRQILKIAIAVFFRRVTIENQHLIPKHGPLIVAANHPNTFMDASVISSILYQKPSFLTTASVFTSPIVKLFFRGLGLIPVVRQQDAKGKRVDNAKAFANCYEELAKGKTILIFPEGTSIHERKLRKIKTGLARIALGAEQQAKFGLGLQILTIGLNYSNPRRFRSDLHIHIYEPIQISEFQAQFQIDEPSTVRVLTRKVKEQLETQIIHTETEDEDKLLHQIEEIYKTRLLKKLGWEQEIHSEKAHIQHHQASKGMAEALHFFKRHDPSRVANLQNELSNYFHNLDQLAIKERVVKKDLQNRTLFWPGLRRLLALVLGFPFYLYGLLSNYLPYIIPSKVAYAITKIEEYIAPIMMMVGVFSFSLFYGLQIYAFHACLGTWWLTLVFAASLPIAGFFCLYYWQKLVDSSDQWTLFSLFRQKNDLLNRLLIQRKQIIQTLDIAQTEYLEREES